MYIEIGSANEIVHAAGVVVVVVMVVAVDLLQVSIILISIGFNITTHHVLPAQNKLFYQKLYLD